MAQRRPSAGHEHDMAKPSFAAAKQTCARCRSARMARTRPSRVKVLRVGSEDTYLTVEEAGIVEMGALDMHEKFLARLTISSLNLLRKVAEEEGCSIEELNAGKVVDWFAADKKKRDDDPDSATLHW
eukprot:scaffold102_cov340-Pavlova_lutheri.AAC.11